MDRSYIIHAHIMLILEASPQEKVGDKSNIEPRRFKFEFNS